ncbi:hypothetical protein MFFC18_28230 [Mariniblastus fucicola]|uniref:Uncharacterized protein n=1 Tax=Mariniblastus fucicola TaxID=980251 RepID=A0A5B9PCQ1_9BACT|nr:hypothetical protein MFFC18_28230 [Mariniblastus fucicola]
MLAAACWVFLMPTAEVHFRLKNFDPFEYKLPHDPDHHGHHKIQHRKPG